ncbi:class 1 fructose-bisphosphatase [Candidatus Haliotispira prima]|uniref:Fructose-1,6-bisphosphatase class 1 n=1 Tax=Candidatus Haliotispira prima TaxID=3034016 RepID=A0ABY8MIX5_9SPIO|nr:class 1 fructose-bisphosphatase [Candidatus Haliotispira prima]
MKNNFTMSNWELPTLAQYLIEERRRYPESIGELNSLLLDIGCACKVISKMLGYMSLCTELSDVSTEINVQGESQKALDVLSNETFIEATQRSGNLVAIVSEEMEEPYVIPKNLAQGKYLLVHDPLDGSSNIDVNAGVGSIFSVFRAPEDVIEGRRPVSKEDFLQPGKQQIAAGYAIYGPSTMLVLTVGRGVHGFTLEPYTGEFRLTHPNMQVHKATNEFAINASNSRFWEAPVKRYIDECLSGSLGPRGKDFNMRWVASMVAEAHRILIRGGVFMYPRDSKNPEKQGRLRLLYEASPIAMLMENAGGMCSTGYGPIHDVEPEQVHQRIGVIFGSAEEVSLIESYHHNTEDQSSYEESPLFAVRGLFRK